MLTTEHDGSVERLILVGMMTDKHLLGRIQPNWTRDGLFDSDLANQVGKWCVKHYEKYGKAPKSAVEGMFSAWAEKTKNKPLADKVEKFLTSLSGEYDKLAKGKKSDYMTDLAARHFNEVAVAKLANDMKADVSAGDPDKAYGRMTTHKPLDFGKGAWIDVLHDKAAIERALSEESAEILVEYPGEAGRFFGDTLARDCFVAFQGPPGRGKSWVLQDVVMRAVMGRRNVAYFQIGDMTEAQIMRRLMIRIARHPRKAGTIDWPKKLIVVGGEPEVMTEEKMFDNPLDLDTAWNACQKLITSTIRSGDSTFKLSVYPNYSVNVLQIRDQLKMLSRNGFVPDVVVIDYADLLLPPPGVRDKLDQIDDTWKYLRSISQELHCLVVTATQSNAQSASARVQGMRHFGGRFTKYAHATAFFALNQTDEEKEIRVMRWNALKEREEEFIVSKCLYVAQCLPLANPCVRSAFSKAPKEEETEE